MPVVSSPKHSNRATRRWLSLKRSHLTSAIQSKQGWYSRRAAPLSFQSSNVDTQSIDFVTHVHALQTVPGVTGCTSMDPSISSAPTRLVSRPANASSQNLPSMLEISKEKFAAVKETIHTLAKNSLTLSLPLKDQPEKSLKDIRIQASRQHPFLCDYEQDWATLEILRRFLKNSSSRARKREQREKE